MRIEVKGRGTAVTEDLREHVFRRFRRVDAQVSALATLEVELREERNPSIAEHCVVDATLHLKGITLRASDRARDVLQAINLVEAELHRQVKRHRDKRRNHRKVGTETIRTAPAPTIEPGVQPAF
jgi:putative sigma-54 modulation protein